MLEIGCGTGYYGFYYADKCQEYLGIDIVPDHIALFKQKITTGDTSMARETWTIRSEFLRVGVTFYPHCSTLAIT